jgi:transposase
MVRKRRTYTAEQKADAVRLVKAAGSYAQVARDLGIDRTVIRAWFVQAQVDAGEGPPETLTTEEKAELARLRRENRRLRMERDFLKKATAFFAREDAERSS